MNERFAPVVGYEALYAVADSGRVISTLTKRVLRGHTNPKGYTTICLCRRGKIERQFLHRIVAAAFIGPRPNGSHIDHVDGNARNNAASNLRYVTPAENRAYTVARGAQAKGSRNGQAKLTEDQVVTIRAAKATGGRFWGAKHYATLFGVTRCQVERAARGETFAHVPAAIRALATEGQCS